MTSEVIIAYLIGKKRTFKRGKRKLSVSKVESSDYGGGSIREIIIGADKSGKVNIVSMASLTLPRFSTIALTLKA